LPLYLSDESVLAENCKDKNTCEKEVILSIFFCYYLQTLEKMLIYDT